MLKHIPLRATLLLLFLFFAGCSRTVRYLPAEPPPPNIAPVLPAIPPPKLVSSRNMHFQPVITKNTAIVLDAGHGGEDFGTHSNTAPKYQEKYLNMSTVFLVKEYLEKMGYKPFLTRSTDEFISLEKRAAMANERVSDIFVSVHYNSAPSPQAEGIEVYFYDSDKDPQRAKSSDALAKSILHYVIENTKAKSRGVKHGNFAVIRETKMPAILIEAGFLTNDQEMLKIKDPIYMKSIAWGIARGIDEYVSKHSGGN